LIAVAVLSLPVPVAQLQASNTATSANPTAADIQVASQLKVPPENTLTIPKLGLHVPVIYGSPPDEDSLQKSLQNGVVHYGGTAKPGEMGNVVIFGHSSNDWWEPGNYKFVFVLLSKMKEGDIIGLDYQSKRHYYVVTGVKVVEPTDVQVLYPTSVPMLTLVTCTPPGTSLKRLIVQAREARSSSNPSSAVASGTPAPAPAAASETPETIIGTSGFATTVRNIVVGIIEKFVPAT
jgi:LPXTG-site transpeptidase (sortase) family protein